MHMEQVWLLPELTPIGGEGGGGGGGKAEKMV